MPGNVISLPGTKCCGSAIQSSSVFSFHWMWEDWRAGESRPKLGSVPAFRFQTPARLGPVMFRSGCKEWHAAQAPKKMRWPRAALPSAARATEEMANEVKIALAVKQRLLMLVSRLLQRQERDRARVARSQ